MCPLPAPSTGAVDVSRSAPSSAFPRPNAGAVERTQHPPRAPPAPGAKGRIVPSMTAYSDAAETRRLPRGWAHFVLQFAIWIGFYAAYQVARGAADQST